MPDTSSFEKDHGENRVENMHYCGSYRKQKLVTIYTSSVLNPYRLVSVISSMYQRGMTYNCV